MLRIFDFDLDSNPLRFDAFGYGGRIWVEKSKMRGAPVIFALPLRRSAQMSGSY
jgi:hypothetical protein